MFKALVAMSFSNEFLKPPSPQPKLYYCLPILFALLAFDLFELIFTVTKVLRVTKYLPL